MTSSDILSNCIGFEWDEYNADKIWLKHHVSLSECEQIFFNLPLVVADDIKHLVQENRFYALGQTDAERFLFMVFTVRKNKIRVISARDMNRKERRVYQSHEDENT
jgi:uncharacterized DUF497 family protein